MTSRCPVSLTQSCSFSSSICSSRLVPLVLVARSSARRTGSPRARCRPAVPSGAEQHRVVVVVVLDDQLVRVGQVRRRAGSVVVGPRRCSPGRCSPPSVGHARIGDDQSASLPTPFCRSHARCACRCTDGMYALVPGKRPGGRISGERVDSPAECGRTCRRRHDPPAVGRCRVRRPATIPSSARNTTRGYRPVTTCAGDAEGRSGAGAPERKRKGGPIARREAVRPRSVRRRRVACDRVGVSAWTLSRSMIMT